VIYSFGDFELDTELYELRRQEATQPIEPQVFDLLRVLIERRERTVTKDELYDSVWQGRIVSEATLSSRIKAARQAVGDSGRAQQVIRTVHGRGFRFVAPVETAESAAAEPQTAEAEGLRDDERPSIAVLPFENLSGSPDEEYFADGISDEITLLLSRYRWLQVISRHSSFAFKGRALGVREIGEALGVRYLIAGSVRRAGTRVRVSVQLVQAADGTQLWSERYDRELADIFELQDEIARTIAGTLEPELAGAEEVRSRRRPPESWTAWDLFQRGRWHVFKFTEEGFAEAERLFAQALAIDPTLAPAHAGQAYVYIQEAFYGGPDNRQTLKEAAFQSARRAVQEDDRDALSHFVLGRAHAIYRRYDESIAELETALELNPSYAHAHFAIGFAYTFGGRPAEAIPHFERFEALSPRDPHIWSNLNVHATACLWLDELEAAEVFAARSVRQSNATRWAFATHAAVLGRAGKTEAARAAAERLYERHPGYSCETTRDDFFFMDHPEHLEVYLDGLRTAGVPDGPSA
jgi:TolB-like protein/Flp pilus assembly protein TadD